MGTAVSSWRTAWLVFDPDGMGRRLQREAQRFRWAPVTRRCDRWAALSVANLAEDVVKLVRALGTGQRELAAIQRNILVEDLPFVLAVRRRMFWASENDLWERVGKVAPPAWRTAHRAGLGVRGSGFEDTCRGALDLYRLSVEDVYGLLSTNQREVAVHACRVAGRLPNVRG